VLSHYTPVFRELPARSIDRVAAMLAPLAVEPGHMLIQQGEPAEELFVLVHGEVSFFKDATDGTMLRREVLRVRDSSATTYFGELALHANAPRAASARAEERSLVFVLSVADFHRFSALVPHFEERAATLQARSDAMGAAPADATADATGAPAVARSDAAASRPQRVDAAEFASHAQPLASWMQHVRQTATRPPPAATPLHALGGAAKGRQPPPVVVVRALGVPSAYDFRPVQGPG
jgi:CRP-like cAMP-binding protein